MILKEALYHRPNRNWAYPYSDEHTVCLRLRTRRGDCDKVELFAGDKYAWEQTHQYYEMHLLTSDALFDYYEIEIRPLFRRLFYSFRLHQGNHVVWLTDQGTFEDYTNSPWRNYEFPFIHKSNLFQPPAWVKDAIFYQIFPDRFACGDESISPQGAETWGGQPTYHNFFGGDLQGVINHLDYLSALGVNAIYFTPIFKAPSNHKYDTEDYFQIDPHFGTLDTLKELVNRCHERGIRVLLDAVFNHSGQQFAPFQDVLLNGEASRFKDWFHVRSFPLEVVDGVPTYDTFAFSPRMPKFNTENPEVRNYLLEVARYWIEEVNIDGWRLDVANEIEHQFWREFRQVVKSIKPDAYILGEVWHDAMPWLEGDMFDAAMNYPWTNAVWDFFARKVVDGKGFADLIGSNLGRFQKQVHEVAFNIIDSHDTERLLFLLNGDTSILKLAALFQFTFSGTPCIYYGTEIGMNGGHDPDCRRCMIWEPAQQNQPLLQHYQQLIVWRKTHSALRTGTFRFLYAKKGDRSIAYERQDEHGSFIIVINANERTKTLRLPAYATHYQDLQSGQTFSANDNTLELQIKRHAFYVLQAI